MSEFSVWRLAHKSWYRETLFVGTVPMAVYPHAHLLAFPYQGHSLLSFWGLTQCTMVSDVNRDQRTFRKEYSQKLEHIDLRLDCKDQFRRGKALSWSLPILKTAWQTTLFRAEKQSGAGNVSRSNQNSLGLSVKPSECFFHFYFFFIHFKGGGGIVLVCVFVYTVMHIWGSGNNMKESVRFFHLMGPRKRTRVDKPDSMHHMHHHPLSLCTLTVLNVEVL